MKRFDDYLLMSRLLRRARFLLPSLFLMALISFSNTTSSVFAQSTAEICRETTKVLKQLDREKAEAVSTRLFVTSETRFREILSALNKGIANGRVIQNRDIDFLVSTLYLEDPGPTTKERLAFQRTVRPLVQRGLQEASATNYGDVASRIQQLDQQIWLREQRISDLNCGKVLERESSGGKTGFLGCFKDSNSPFDLDGFLERSSSNTPQKCIETCREKGFAYAGVQYGESCLCGNSYGKQGKSSDCNMKCTGDSSQICGGLFCNSVYGTGIVPK